MRKLMCGKFDSQFKWQYKMQTGRMRWNFLKRTVKERGHFMTPMAYACLQKGGMRTMEHAKAQPWETWQSLTRK